MFSTVIRSIARHFIAPTFTRRRSFGGSVVLTCQETGEAYSIIPAGPIGFYAAGAGGRLLGPALNHSLAAELIEADARQAIRSLAIAA